MAGCRATAVIPLSTQKFVPAFPRPTRHCGLFYLPSRSIGHVDTPALQFLNFQPRADTPPEEQS